MSCQAKDHPSHLELSLLGKNEGETRTVGEGRILMRMIVTMTDLGNPERMADLQGRLGMVSLAAEDPLLCVSLARIATGSPSAGLVILREATWIPTM